MTTLYVTRNAWRQIEAAVRRHPSVETGGILMGYQLTDDAWIITYASGPGPGAIHLPRAIRFDDSYLRRLIRKVKRKSGGRWQYVGDWHSHTVKRLSPSRADRFTIRQKSEESRYASPWPFMLIVGTGRGDQMHGRAFVLANSLREVRQVEVIDGKAARQLRAQTAWSPDADR